MGIRKYVREFSFSFYLGSTILRDTQQQRVLKRCIDELLSSQFISCCDFLQVYIVP